MCWMVGWLVGWLDGWMVGWLVGWLVVVLVLVLFPQSWCYIDFETHLISPMAHLKSKTKVFNKLPWWWVERLFNFHPYLGKSKLNNMFQIGWNHQPVTLALFSGFFPLQFTCNWKSYVFGCSLDVLGWFPTLWLPGSSGRWKYLNSPDVCNLICIEFDDK